MKRKTISIIAVVLFSAYLLAGCAAHQKCAAYSDTRSIQDTHTQSPSRG